MILDIPGLPSALIVFDALARQLAAGAEVAADRVLVVLAAAGRTNADLQAACDHFAAEESQGPAGSPAA